MPTYLVVHPKGKGEDVLVQDDYLTLDFRHGWAVLSDQHGPCMAIPASSGATITRIDPDEDQPTQE
ncbi:hypothetical protein AB0O20_06345 [Streptomyces kronopolitis]|uniref:hypothetical protein n=1 Tax=Streptomyces kronopolitis TaxID=1612435 RepID=UPI003429C2B9